MIDIHGNGRLIDFDLAQPKGLQKLPGGVSLHCFSLSIKPVTDCLVIQGTWHFASTLSLLFSDRIHQLADELESLFFVFLFLALHYVTHNKPYGLNIKDIFDDVGDELDDREHRGSGKSRMYLVKSNLILHQLKFEQSPPLTDLLRELFRLFQSLTLSEVGWKTGCPMLYKDVVNCHKLMDCRVIIQLMKAALKMPDWPDECDKVDAGNYTR